MMTNLEREIQVFILKALLATKGRPMTDDSLRRAISAAFQHIAMTPEGLGAHIEQAKDNEMISGADDEVFGKMWALTPKGTIKAQQLR